MSASTDRRPRRVDPRAAISIAVVAFTISALVAFLVSAGQPGTFEGRTTVSETFTGRSLDVDAEEAAAQRRRLELHAEVALSRVVLDTVITRLQLDTTARSLARRTDATVSNDGRVLAITARNGDAALAATLANSIAQEVIQLAQEDSQVGTSLSREIDADLSTRVERLESLLGTVARLESIEDPTRRERRVLNRLSASLDASRTSAARLVPFSSTSAPAPIAVLEPAVSPTVPSDPVPVLDGLFGGVMGVLIVLPLIFVPRFLDASVRDAADARYETGLRTLAVVPRVKGDRWRRALFHTPMLLAQDSPAADAYRAVRLGFELASAGPHARVIMVVAPRRSDSKSVTAANVAIALAQAGRSVVLMDADLDSPRIHRILHVENDEGLVDVLVGQSSLADELNARLSSGGLRVLTAGDGRRHRSGHLGSASMRHLVGELKASNDIIVIDGPPMLESDAAEILVPMADSVILALTAGRSRRADVNVVVGSLNAAHARMLGVVLVHEPRRFFGRLLDHLPQRRHAGGRSAAPVPETPESAPARSEPQPAMPTETRPVAPAQSTPTPPTAPDPGATPGVYFVEPTAPAPEAHPTHEADRPTTESDGSPQ